MKNKKTIIAILIVAVIAVVAVIAAISPEKASPSATPSDNATAEEKIEYAVEASDLDYLYSLLYSGSDEEPTPEDLAEGLTVLSAFFRFGEDVTVKKEGDIYIVTDINGSSLRFTPKDNGKYEMGLVSTQTTAFTVYAPKGSAVTLDGKELTYNESSKNYYIFGISRGTYLLRIEKEGCLTYETNVEVGTETSVEVNLDYTEDYLAIYEEQAVATLRSLMERCANGTGDLSTFTFKNDHSELVVRNLIEGIIRDISEEADNITVGNIRFVSFSGEKVSHYNENDGCCVANLQYEYSYTMDGKVFSNTGDALISMEKLDGVWLLEDAYFSMYTL